MGCAISVPEPGVGGKHADGSGAPHHEPPVTRMTKTDSSQGVTFVPPSAAAGDGMTANSIKNRYRTGTADPCTDVHQGTYPTGSYIYDLFIKEVYLPTDAI